MYKFTFWFSWFSSFAYCTCTVLGQTGKISFASFPFTGIILLDALPDLLNLCNQQYGLETRTSGMNLDEATMEPHDSYLQVRLHTKSLRFGVADIPYSIPTTTAASDLNLLVNQILGGTLLVVHHFSVDLHSWIWLLRQSLVTITVFSDLQIVLWKIGFLSTLISWSMEIFFWYPLEYTSSNIRFLP